MKKEGGPFRPYHLLQCNSQSFKQRAGELNDKKHPSTLLKHNAPPRGTL